MDKTLRIPMCCPRGGKGIYVDDEGNLHAGRLQRYIETAKYMNCERLQFDDTVIILKTRTVNESNKTDDNNT